MKSALYIRVSTQKQNDTNQEDQLRTWAGNLGFEVTAVFSDTASGRRADRAAVAQLLKAAYQREFDCVLFWSLDRLSREGIKPMLGYLEEIKRAGGRVMSFRESWVDTASPVWDLLVAVVAWVAQQETEQLRARVLAGLARARLRGTRSGKPIGRPARQIDVNEVTRRRADGQSWRRIAKALKVPSRTLRGRAGKALTGLKTGP